MEFEGGIPNNSKPFFPKTLISLNIRTLIDFVTSFYYFIFFLFINNF